MGVYFVKIHLGGIGSEVCVMRMGGLALNQGDK